MSLIRSYRELDVYKSAMELTMEVFRLTKTFPPEERYSLTDQIRRSSRSVCANLAEAWRKRRYTAAFIAKLNDAEAEAAETQVWLEIAFRAGYLKQETVTRLNDACEKILGQLVCMADQPQKWVIGSRRAHSPVPPLALSRSPS
jgi:four helix bundle protein